MHYVTVFDASRFSFRHWEPVAIGVCLVAIGLAAVFKPNLARSLTGGSAGPLFSWCFVALGAFWTITAASALYETSSSARMHAKNRECATVEGRVRNFHPMPYEGHDLESFDVGDQHFDYSDFILSGGFNNAASHGGPIREGLPVRICHRDGNILILEVAA